MIMNNVTESKRKSSVSKAETPGLSRRELVGKATAIAALTFVPSYVLGHNGSQPPSDKLNIAAIGVGGMGASNIN